MKTQNDRTSLIRRLGVAAIAGALALGFGGVALAHGSGGYGKHGRVKVVHHHYHPARHHRGHHRGHHGRRPVQVVHVNHYNAYPVAPRPVVVERYEAPYPSPAYAPVTPTLNPGSLMGAAIGGLIGSQVGGGTGKLAATAAGTVGGFLLGDHATRGYR